MHGGAPGPMHSNSGNTLIGKGFGNAISQRALAMLHISERALATLHISERALVGPRSTPVGCARADLQVLQLAAVEQLVRAQPVLGEPRPVLAQPVDLKGRARAQLFSNGRHRAASPAGRNPQPQKPQTLNNPNPPSSLACRTINPKLSTLKPKA